MIRTVQISECNQISDNVKDEPINNLRWKTCREN